MSAFVHPENQKIIWNIVNSNIYVNDFFQKHTHVSKEQWFRSIIEKFYMQNEGKNITMDELNTLNRDVLTFMVKSIHSIPVQPTPPESPQISQQPIGPYTNQPDMNYSPQIQTPPYVANNMGEQNNKEFEEKRLEYERMHAKPVPEPVDFKEKETDTIIENMDELINKHMTEREQQLKELVPPQIVTNVQPAVSMPSKDTSNNITVDIQENSITNTSIQTDETPTRIELLELKEQMNMLQQEYNEVKTILNEKIQNQQLAISNMESEIRNLRENANKIHTLDQQSEKSDE